MSDAESRAETSFDAKMVFTARAPKPTPPVAFQNAAEYPRKRTSTVGTSSRKTRRRRKKSTMAKTTKPAARATNAARRSDKTNTQVVGTAANTNPSRAHGEQFRSTQTASVRSNTQA